ncbi:BtrH N-terminal domain-containing protein [Enterococcus sp. BWR-S5]|uniref:BtrH N-terminal domain-containing protein n=1 Tax=Enterococcus sp. BWR-S5 TaxID=2787714 RepID=UPI0019235657|nr:BtrH N-terminal domain-containing protein [Enterococcus sp. BWR-S5]MBL1225869.1 BtrH N-terminal domain-containing protein [Enterococcus sp. BWR-S5]
MKHIIKGFTPTGGDHCITHALKQLFAYHGYPLSEAMLFGLGEGLDFTYINLQHSPMISGRSKILEFERKLADNLGIALTIQKPKTNEQAFNAAKRKLIANQPLLIYTDMAYLPYFSLESENHFGGHAVILYGFDDEKQLFYLSDRDHSDFPIRTPSGLSHEDYHLISYNNLSLARGSKYRPFPANNKSISFDFSSYQPPQKTVLLTAIKHTVEKMLYPSAKLKGIQGIEKFSKQVLSWKKFDAGKLRTAGATNYFQINKDGGTGGGIFRSLFGRFLIEAAAILQESRLEKNGTAFIELASSWDRLADDMWTLHTTADQELLPVMSKTIEQLYLRELTLLKELEQLL